MVEPEFNANINLVAGGTTALPVGTKAPLFIVGPNGVGKSGLMLTLYRNNVNRAVRVAAHRQTWMETNAVPFSPQDKITMADTTKSQDSQSYARWREWSPNVRSGLVIADLIDADNALSRSVREALKGGDEVGARRIANDLPPLETINELLAASGIPITMSIQANSTIVASKRGGPQYSIAALSDGERAAMLIAGTVLTANAGSLILIDEPERHLHSSIVTPLLLQLFSKRPDCAFVVATHELGLPVSAKGSKTVLVRDSRTSGDDVANWEIDVLDSATGVDEATKEAIIGSRRKLLFIEGTLDSLDKPLYELLFPSVTIFPRATCSDVQHAVGSIRDSSELVWVRAFGIVDLDQISTERRTALETGGVYPLSVYSVEGLYYSQKVIAAVAARQSSVLGNNAGDMINAALTAVLRTTADHAKRLAARMSEQVVKDQIGIQMPDWKRIQDGHPVEIKVDSAAIYAAEQATLTEWLRVSDVDSILARYPIRETQALDAVANALQFKSRALYEAAVRKLVAESDEIRAYLLSYFGGLPAAISQG